MKGGKTLKRKINISGPIIPNDYKWYYDLFEMDSTCGNDVKKVLNQFEDGDEIEVYINSPGGVIDVGSEIYTILREKSENLKIFITGEACSAASIIAMAGYCEMSPTALMMVHCVSTGARGNHNELEKTANVLKTADMALCKAYADKSGMTEEDALAMMEEETWLTANQALEKGLIDKVMFSENQKHPMAACNGFNLPSEEQMEQARKMIKDASKEKDAFFMQQKLNLLKMKGETK